MKIEKAIQLPKCKIQKNGLILNEDLTKDEWHDIGGILKTMEGCIQFWIGDWLCHGEKKWGEMYKEAEDITGLDNGTLRNMKSVAASVDLSLRSDNLTFEHHKLVAPLPPEKQEKFLELAEKKDMTVSELRQAVREGKHDDKEAQPFPKGKFEIIYMDPPWKYDKDEEYFGQDVEKHYPTMTYDQLLELPVKTLAYKDCVLYLWTTAPKLNWGIDLLRAWGFDYKTCLIWNKVKHNMGFYASIRHEILLIGGVGQSSPTDKKYANQTNSIYTEERTEHSRKPDYYYEMIEKMHPTKTHKIELFQRRERKGWTGWGNEIKKKGIIND